MERFGVGTLDFPEAAGEIAQSFVTARREGSALPDYPGTLPTTLDQGYSVQDAALALAGGTVAGWKVGRINPPIDGIDRLAGPIFSDKVFDEGADPVPMPIFAEGFGAAEAEFLLRIGTAPDPAKTSYTMDEAIAMIDAVHVGIEVASSPFPGINTNGAAVTISDFGNNNGLVVGTAIPADAFGGINDWLIESRINGELIASGYGRDMLDGPFGAARFLLESLAQRGIALEPGQWISSGAVTGVHPVQVGDHFEARFNGQFTVECSITAS
jgi:2-keto-4-pentenoate hydratase